VHKTSKGVPAGSAEMLEPGERREASWVWKGPRTVPSVREGGLGWSMESTRRERPTMSERRMNSFQHSQHGRFRSGREKGIVLVAHLYIFALLE
jgi:hypothetical protein